MPLTPRGRRGSRVIATLKWGPERHGWVVPLETSVADLCDRLDHTTNRDIPLLKGTVRTVVDGMSISLENCPTDRELNERLQHYGSNLMRSSYDSQCEESLTRPVPGRPKNTRRFSRSRRTGAMARRKSPYRPPRSKGVLVSHGGTRMIR